MSRVIQVLALLALSASTAACAADNPTSPDSVVALNSLNAPVTRPAGGTCLPQVTVVAPFPGPTQPILNLSIEGVCTLRHLGLTTMQITETVDFSTGIILNATAYTAANGDVLNSTFVGTLLSPPGPDAVFEGTETYVGGTGRFVNVSGSSFLEGTAHLVGLTGTGQYTTIGTITY